MRRRAAFDSRYEQVLDGWRDPVQFLKGQPGGLKPRANLRDPPRGVIDHQMDAVADQHQARDPGRPRDFIAYLSRLRRQQLQCVAWYPCLERGRCVAEQQAALMEQANPMATLRLIKIGGRGEDRDSLGE